MYRFLILLLLIISVSPMISVAQETHPTEGLRHNTPNVHAYTNATIVVSPDQTIQNGTLVVRDGIIEAVGETITLPADARIWDCSGLTIYPGLIEPLHEVDGDPSTQPNTYWNPTIRPEQDALELYAKNTVSMETLRKLGFTSVHIIPKEGTIRGTSALMTTSDAPLSDRTIKQTIVNSLSFDRVSNWSDYPGSLMGRIALIRQAFYDANWYRSAHQAFANQASQPKPEENRSLEALQPILSGTTPLLAIVDEEKSFLRTQALADEFSLNLWFTGNGYEYRNINLYTNLNQPLILPLAFPKKPNVKTHDETLDISLNALRHWERAPSNPAVLEAKSIPFTLTTFTHHTESNFVDHIHEAQKHGLSDTTLLAALTTVPAKLLGIDKQLGTLETGKRGHFIISDGTLFNQDSKIHDVWIEGKRFNYFEPQKHDPRGTWNITAHEPSNIPQPATLEIAGKPESLKAEIIFDATPKQVKWIELDHDYLSMQLSGDDFDQDGVYQLSASFIDEQITGSGVTHNGEPFKWSAQRMQPHTEDDPDDETKEKEDPTDYKSRIVYPASPYGNEAEPLSPKTILITNATVWTSGSEGILENTDILIEDGKIAEIGSNLSAPEEAHVIDAQGKHVTPGLIDCHSHIAIEGGVNENQQAVTSEVRIGDVLEHDDINIYRQLAGGLTMSHLLHGSANPIGGQSQLIKLKWGSLPEDLKEKRAPATIKFALGENVKQSNWGENYTTRYPQTRMGVEQIIRDRFMAAQDYQIAWQDYQSSSNPTQTIPPRKDLELDALVEIINQERWIHCHSYRQDEILMLMRLMETFDVQVGTFQHILEGYKVADIMVKHGAAGSAFSDWWAYKFEVYDAIPYAGTLMHNQGVLTSFNSDDAELARRMNTEAAKAVQYGGMNEEDALKLVTINPAKQLKIDHLVGSLETGKDADFVIWSNHPLSTYAVCEQTWIEGTRYFSLEDDAQKQQAVQQERTALIQKLLDDSKPKKDDKDESEEEDENQWSEFDQSFWFETILSHEDYRGICGCVDESHADLH